MNSPVLRARLQFEDYEVPVASSMVPAADKLIATKAHQLHVFTCYWAGFNSIYATVAERAGRKPELRTKADGSVRMRTIGSVVIPEVNAVSEREQIDLAFDQFSDDLRSFLAGHDSTRFFAYRTPAWGGFLRATDAKGQKINGVISVGRTIDAANIVWSPIETKEFEAFVADPTRADLRDSLARQVLDVLYTVRNNTVHGGKRADDANDSEVLDKAVPLLAAIVKSFLKH